jgi:putative ABC transport system permease protein
MYNSLKWISFFVRLFVWFNVRNMRKHPLRALTVLVGIALGAAVFTSVRLSIDASLDTFTKSMDLIAGQSDLALIRPGGYVEENLISGLLKHPAIRGASPISTTYVRPTTAGAEPFLLIGFDPILDRSFRPWQVERSGDQDSIAWLNLIKDPYTIIVGDALARQFGWTDGKRVQLEHSYQTATFKILGILKPEGMALAEGGKIALVDMATFQEFTGLFRRVDRIDLLLKTDAVSSPTEEIRKLISESIELVSPSATKESGQGMIRAYQLNLSILSFASLFVGMFLVYSLVALNAASRRRELAILRACGASARLLFIIFLAEGALLGIVGWLAAIPISSFLVKYLLQAVSQTVSTLFVRVSVDELALDPMEIFLSFGLTVLISILAALQPAKEAMRVHPIEALEISQRDAQFRKSPKQLAVHGLVSLILMGPLSQIPALHGVPLSGYAAIVLLFLGFSLLSPYILDVIGRTVSPVFHRLAGMPAYLAGRYVRESGARTAVSVGALLTAVAVFASLVIMIHSFRQTVDLWVHQTIRGDLFVTTKMGDINNFRYPVPREVIDGLHIYRDQADIVPNRRYSLFYDTYPYEFEVLDLKMFFRYGDFFWLKGDPQKIRPRLINGEGVVISEVFSNRTGLTIGDSFQARVENSVVVQPILAIVRDYRTQGGVVFYAMQSFKNDYHDPQWGGFRVFFRNRSQDLEAAVSGIQADLLMRWPDKLGMIGGNRLRQAVLRIFDETFAITSVLLFIALVIAALGITTTLTVLVLERSRQLNTIFAVGGSFSQIRSMIFWEAVFMVVAGELAGIVCGFILSYLLVYVINAQSFGWTFLYRVNWPALALSVPLIIITALAAAIPAVRLVFRGSPAMLLRER